MIYIKNTTDAQVIFIDRETQSIENITPITSDSNYYTKVEVDAIAQGTLEQSKEYTNNLANEYYDIAEEYIDSNIERLENRIDELENNGGTSNDNTPLIIELSSFRFMTESEFDEIFNNFNKTKVIVLFEITGGYQQIEIVNVKDYTHGKTIVGLYSGDLFDQEISIIKWIKFGGNISYNYTTIDNAGIATRLVELETDCYGTYFPRIEANTTRIVQIEDDVDDLEGRITELENNGGTSNDNTPLIIELSETDDYSLRTDDAKQIINNFKTKKVIIKFVYTDIYDNNINTEIEVVNVEYNNENYMRIVGIFNDLTYIWEYPIDSYPYAVKPKIIGVIKYGINSPEDNYSIYESDLESLIQTKKNNPNSRIVLYHRGFDSFITDVVSMDYFLNYDNEQNFYVYAIVGSKMLRWKYSKTYNSNPIVAEIKNLWE